MKHISTLLITSVVFSSPCLSMEPAARKTREAQIIPLKGLINPSAIAFPTQEHVVIGGANDCILFCQTSGSEFYLTKSIAMFKTFSIDAHKQEGLVVITNEKEILVYTPRTDRIIWSNYNIPKKNITAIFGPAKTIVALNPTDQSITTFDYEKNNLSPKQHINSCIFNPNSSLFTSPISYQSYSAKIAYLNDKNQAVVKELSNPTNTQTKKSENYKDVLLSPYSRYVALAAGQGCTIWNPTTNESYDIDDIYKPDDTSRSNTKTKLYIKSMSFHPNGCLALLTAHGLGYTLKYFNLNKRTLINDEDIPLKKGAFGMKALDISPEGTDVVVLGEYEFFIAPVPLKVLAQNDAN